MSDFCPEGYMSAHQAVFTAAQHWFPQEPQVGEVTEDSLSGAIPKNSIEQAIRAFSSSPFPETWHRATTETVHRLRNLLHQGTLKAYYFDGFGLQAVPREFWSTAAANGALEQGVYLPFGRPEGWTAATPAHYQIFFEEDGLHRGLNENKIQKPWPDSRISVLTKTLEEFDQLPRKAQFQAVREKLVEYRITERQLRAAAQSLARPPGRKSRQKS